jgi:hypothetical protein
MLFKVTEKDVFEDNPELNSVPEFIGKSSRMLKYIFLVYDFDGPYRKMPLPARKERCVIQAGYKYESDGKRLDKNARDIVNGNNPTVLLLTKVFHELQGDPDKENLAALDAQLLEWRELMHKKNKTDKEQTLVFKLINDWPKFMQRRKEILEILGERTKEEAEDISRPMSTIDEVNSEDQD